MNKTTSIKKDILDGIIVHSKQQSQRGIAKKDNEVEIHKIKNSKEEYELAVKLIKNNIDDVPSFHIKK